MRMRIFHALAAVLLLLSALCGCKSAESDFVSKSDAELNEMETLAETAHESFADEKFPEAETLFRQLASERTVSLDLYRLEVLSTLLLQHKDDEARQLLYDIREDLDTLADDKQSEKARSIWHGEQNKVFKGDSYERSAFYALLALSFLRDGKYEDALRSVKNGLLADADSNSDKALGDNVLLLYLGAFAARKLGDHAEADEYMRNIRAVLPQRGLSMPENPDGISPLHCFSSLMEEPGNVLLVIWAGRPPVIARAGEYNEKRYVVSGSLPFNALTLSVDGGAPRLFPQALGDVNYQATTRGGRLMDEVLSDKADVKKVTEISRNVFFIVGTALIACGNSSAAGLACLCAGGCCYVAGGICWVAGSMMNPEADARYWKNLPCQFCVMPMSLVPGRHSVKVDGFLYGDHTFSRTYDIDVRRTPAVDVIHLPLLNQDVPAEAADGTEQEGCSSEG